MNIFKPIEPIFEFYNESDSITIWHKSVDYIIKVAKTPAAKILGVCNCSSPYFKINDALYPKCAECSNDLMKRISIERL